MKFALERGRERRQQESVQIIQRRGNHENTEDHPPQPARHQGNLTVTISPIVDSLASAFPLCWTSILRAGFCAPQANSASPESAETASCLGLRISRRMGNPACWIVKRICPPLRHSTRVSVPETFCPVGSPYHGAAPFTFPLFAAMRWFAAPSTARI